MIKGGYAALDIGGTKIAYAFLDDHGMVKRYDDKETPKRWRELSGAILHAVEEVTENGPLKGIGISVAGPVTDDGVVVETANVAFPNNFRMKDFLNGFVPISVENDARCFALGVHRYELDGKYKNMVCLTLGTGLGGAVMIDGELEPRPKVPSEEIGHTILVSGGRGCKCGCGRSGCFEAYVSGTTIENKYLAATGSVLPAKEIAKMGDRHSIYIMDETRRYFGMVLERLVEKYDPEIIVVGGGLSNAARMMEQECDILRKSELEDAALLGAVVPLL